LLGLRPHGVYTAANVRRFLPRVSRSDLVELLGVDELSATDGPLHHVLSAVVSAAALPALVGSSREVVAARRAVLEIVGRRLSPPQLARSLDVSPRTVHALRTRPPDHALVEAARLQLGLMAKVSLIGQEGAFLPPVASSRVDVGA